MGVLPANARLPLVAQLPGDSVPVRPKPTSSKSSPVKPSTVTTLPTCAESPNPIPLLPLDLFPIIAHHLLPPEPCLSIDNDFSLRHQTLISLCLTSYPIYSILHPILFRSVNLRSGHDIIRLLIQLIRKPKLRQQVRHIYCDTTKNWADAQKDGRILWEAEWGKGRVLESVLAENSFMWCPEDPILQIEQELYFQSGMAYDMDDVLHLAFGGILMMVPNLESLSLHREITRSGYMADIRAVIESADKTNSILPNLRVVKLIEDHSQDHYESARTDLLPCFLSFLTHYKRGEKLILSGVNENLLRLMKTLVSDYGEVLPSVQELIVRPWVTPPQLGSQFADGVVPPLVYQPLSYLPSLFTDLEVLEVEFTSEPNRLIDLWSPLQMLSKSLRVLRLKRQRFPVELFRGPFMEALEEVVLEECSTCRHRPNTTDIRNLLVECEGQGSRRSRLQTLDRLEVNCSKFRVWVTDDEPSSFQVLDLRVTADLDVSG